VKLNFREGADNSAGRLDDEVTGHVVAVFGRHDSDDEKIVAAAAMDAVTFPPVRSRGLEGAEVVAVGAE
jgi:hypothetical protein